MPAAAEPAVRAGCDREAAPPDARVTDWCLDQVIESGEIDFVVDLAEPVPAMATLAFLGLEAEHWHDFSWPFHDIVACPPQTEGWNRAVEGISKALGAVAAAIADRRSNPRDDLLTYFIRAEVDGETLSDEVTLEICTLILGGDVDTTTGLVAHALNHLGHDREARSRIIEDRDLIPHYCEELLRFYTPTQALARTATKDTTIGGQPVAAGGRVMMCWAGANRDPEIFDRPDELVIDRFPNRHAAFGLGAHRCLGSNFARAEFGAMLNGVLDRMPDYELVEGSERYRSIGIVNGWHRLPARFTPGKRDLPHQPFVVPEVHRDWSSGRCEGRRGRRAVDRRLPRHAPRRRRCPCGQARDSRQR